LNTNPDITRCVGHTVKQFVARSEEFSSNHRIVVPVAVCRVMKTKSQTGRSIQDMLDMKLKDVHFYLVRQDTDVVLCARLLGRSHLWEGAVDAVTGLSG